MFTLHTLFATSFGFAINDIFSLGIDPVLIWIVAILLVLMFVAWMSVRFVSNDYVAIVEKLWSPGGSVSEGRIIALGGEAGYQAELLRGGVHFGYWRWQYRIHKTRLVTVAQGKIGYIYARDGQPLPSSQTLGASRRLQQFPRRAAVFCPAMAPTPASASAAANARSCAKASTPSTWRCSS